MKSRDPNRSRIEVDGEMTGEHVTLVGDTLAAMAYPGVFAGGKKIIRVSTSKQLDLDVVNFLFNDGSEMNIVGRFEVRYKEPGSSSGFDAIEQGNKLMSGEVVDEVIEDGEYEEPLG